MALCPALSRRELGHTVCEHLGWYTAKGATRVRMGLGLLEQLEDLGILTLPARRAAMRRGPRTAIARTDRTAPQPAITGALATLTPLTLELVRGRGADRDEMVDRYHYLGYTQPFGPYLRYSIRDRDGHALGCLLFAAAITELLCRDRWIGWSEKVRLRHLPHVEQAGHDRLWRGHRLFAIDGIKLNLPRADPCGLRPAVRQRPLPAGHAEPPLPSA